MYNDRGMNKVRPALENKQRHFKSKYAKPRSDTGGIFLSEFLRLRALAVRHEE